MALNNEAQKFLVARLNQNNYQQWKFKLEMLLLKEDLWETVINDPPSTITTEWKRKDGSARGTIALTVEPALHHLIKECLTAKNMWIKIKTNFERVGLISKVYLKRKLFTTKLEQFKGMEEFLANINDQVGRLRMAGDIFDETDMISTILCGLPENFDNLIMGLETRDESTLTLDYVQSKLIDEFTRREEKTSNNEQQALLTTNNYHGRNSQYKQERKCFQCQKTGHIKYNCPQNGRSTSTRETQNRPGFNNFNAPKNRGENSYSGEYQNYDRYSEREQATERSEEVNETEYVTHEPHNTQYYYSYASTNEEQGKGSNNDKFWIMDSGATTHMCGDNTNFINFEKFPNKREVVFANGTKAEAIGIGSIPINHHNEENKEQFLLQEVIVVPELKVNLMSIPALCSQNLRVIFENDCCTVNDNYGTLLKGNLDNGVFKLNLLQEQNTEQVMSACVHTWHRRLGHRNLETIRNMNKKGLVKNMNISKCQHDDFCQICHKGGLTQGNFQKVTHAQSEKIFQLLHTDICGPINPVSKGGGHYFMTIIDDFSRYCFVKILKYKSEATSTIIDFIQHGKNKFGYYPTYLRSDGGGEYENQQLNDYLTSIGTKHQLIIPFSPQQNGISERINRTLITMTKCIMFDKVLNKNMWGEAVASACYLYNRIEHSHTNHTPYYLWEGRIPDVNHLRIIDSKVLTYVPKFYRSKLEENAKEGTLVGYSDRQKGFKVIDDKDGKIIMAKSVKFDQNGTNRQIINIMNNKDLSDNEVEFPIRSIEELKQQDECKSSWRKSSRANFGKPPARYDD